MRRPGLVGGTDGLDVTGGLDTDADGLPDTIVTDDGADLVLHTDLDGDGLADQVLHIGPDASVWEEVIAVLDRLMGGEPSG
jgi:hypothetical protein